MGAVTDGLDGLCPALDDLAAGAGEEAGRLIRGPLTAEVADVRSPVRQFLSERFTSGLRACNAATAEVPRRWLSPAPSGEANPGTVGTAADWLLRFLLIPGPP